MRASLLKISAETKNNVKKNGTGLEKSFLRDILRGILTRIKS